LKAGVVLGVGLGGFADGIVLHQILQWHHMLSSDGFPPTSLENMRVNVLWDGIFHAFTWLMTALGLALLWRLSRSGEPLPSTRQLIGGLSMGWGLFNLVEGIVNHHILGIHHVREDVSSMLLWDLGFLAFGIVLMVTGMALSNLERTVPAPPAIGSERR
jgi:uncharacterized membrane protein